MSKPLQRDIDRLLGEIEQTGITEEVQIETAIAVDEEGTPTLHIFLVDGNEEENTVEGSLEGVQQDSETDQEQAGPPHPMSWEYPLWARVISLLGVVVFFGPVLLVPVGVPVFQLPVTVMIEPVTAQLELETAIALPARRLSAPTLSQSKTTQTTGKGYQPTRAAQGLVTLYNALPSAQYVQAGTLITSRSGSRW